jgi:hypothetical protein
MSTEPTHAYRCTSASVGQRAPTCPIRLNAFQHTLSEKLCLSTGKLAWLETRTVLSRGGKGPLQLGTIVVCQLLATITASYGIRA